MVFQDGKERLYAQAGHRDIENNVAFDRDTIFRLYSMSKPITSAAAMVLVEKGLLDLGTEVSYYMGGFKNKLLMTNGKEPLRQIWVNDLLNMTCGLPYPDEPGEPSFQSEQIFKEIEANLNTDHERTTQWFATKAGEMPIMFNPGSEWHYGIGADVLGAVIEKVADMPLGEFMKKEIFNPLGMDSTGFFVPKEKQDKLAKAYASKDNSIMEEKTCYLGLNYNRDHAPAFESGGAGLVSTIDDYMHFGQMLLNKGCYRGVRILKPETVTHMTTAAVRGEKLKNMWDHLSGFSYGNLMRICTDPGAANCIAFQDEYGWDGWMGGYFANLPNEHLTLVIGMQKVECGTWRLTRNIRNAVLSRLV